MPAELQVGVALPRVAAAKVHQPRDRRDDRHEARELGEAVQQPHYLRVLSLRLSHDDFPWPFYSTLLRRFALFDTVETLDRWSIASPAQCPLHRSSTNLPVERGWSGAT